MARQPAGCVKALTCQYHGWTCLLDGSLARVVEGVVERIAPVRLDAMTFVQRVDHEVRCNWKLYVDNFLEGCHVPFVHPELMKLRDFRQYRTEVSAHHSLQWTPLVAGDAPYAIRPGDNAHCFCIFPNLMRNILPGRVQTDLAVPLAHDRCRVEFGFHHRDATGPAAERAIADDLACSDRVQREDTDTCGHVQRGVASRAYDRGRFSVDAELGVHHFQARLRLSYRGWAPPS